MNQPLNPVATAGHRDVSRTFDVYVLKSQGVVLDVQADGVHDTVGALDRPSEGIRIADISLHRYDVVSVLPTGRVSLAMTRGRPDSDAARV